MLLLTAARQLPSLGYMLVSSEAFLVVAMADNGSKMMYTLSLQHFVLCFLPCNERRDPLFSRREIPAKAESCFFYGEPVPKNKTKQL